MQLTASAVQYYQQYDGTLFQIIDNLVSEKQIQSGFHTPPTSSCFQMTHAGFKWEEETGSQALLRRNCCEWNGEPMHPHAVIWSQGYSFFNSTWTCRREWDSTYQIPHARPLGVIILPRAALDSLVRYLLFQPQDLHINYYNTKRTPLTPFNINITFETQSKAKSDIRRKSNITNYVRYYVEWH